MPGLLALKTRMAADHGRVYWQHKDFDRLAAHYKCTPDEVAKLVTPAPAAIVIAPDIVNKSEERAAQPSTYKFILNDGLRDRQGDIVTASGVSLEHFRRNSIALLQHDPNRPIGTWSNVRAERGELKGNLHLATGAFTLAEKARAGIEAGVYRAISIGFIPEQWEFDRSPGGNMLFHKVELLEASLVSIPASRGALRERSNEERAAEMMAGIHHAVDVVRQPAPAPKLEPSQASAAVAAARAQREELERISRMTVQEYTDHLNEKGERKEQRQRRLEELRGRS